MPVRTVGRGNEPWDRLGRRWWGWLPGHPLVALLLVASPLAGQESASPIRFAVAWTSGSPHGNLGTIAEAPGGFTAQLALPLARNTAVGIRAEFSVLTFPERAILIAADGEHQEITVTARGTIGFTGAGPRLEGRLGPLAIGAGIMGGFVRVITDANVRGGEGATAHSALISESDFALAGKVAVDLHLALFRGPYGTAVGLVAGADWSTGGEVAFPDLQSFRLATSGELTLQRPLVTPSVSTVRLGVAVEL